MIEDKNVLTKLNECIEKNKSVAMVTIVSSDGSTPRGVGSSMLVDEDGNLLEGTVGGGILEEKLKKDAAKCIRNKESKLMDYNLDRNAKDANILPMICGGKVSSFVKVYSPQEKLVIAGAGHISEKVARIAKMLGYLVTVIDSRKERVNSEIFPDIKNLIHGDIVENLKNINIDSNTFVIIVTHGHTHDEEALGAVLGSQAKYIGMIGSISKIKGCFASLLQKGYTKEELSKVYTPIGIDLGGEAPGEIALAILAEIQALKYGKDLPYLSKKVNKFE